MMVMFRFSRKWGNGGAISASRSYPHLILIGHLRAGFSSPLSLVALQLEESRLRGDFEKAAEDCISLLNRDIKLIQYDVELLGSFANTVGVV
jgi:hypothetical protein